MSLVDEEVGSGSAVVALEQEYSLEPIAATAPSIEADSEEEEQSSNVEMPAATEADEAPSLIEEWVHGSLFFFFVGILGLLAKVSDYMEGNTRFLIDPAALLCCVLGFLGALPFSYGRTALFFFAREIVRACIAIISFFINRIRG